MVPGMCIYIYKSPTSTTVSGEWDYRPQADLIVSELLGSFADNELSPECLDGAVTAMDGWNVIFWVKTI